MSEETKQKPYPPRFPIWPLLLVAGFVILIHGAWWLIGDTIVAQGGLADGDSYTRLVRVERLIDTGAWFDGALPRANAPFGITSHWTRPLDVALIALAAPLMPVLGVKSALYWSGVFISPLFHLLSALALVWAATPFLGRVGALAAGALTATQFGILPFSIIGRPDHHAVFGVTVFLTLGFLARSFADPPSRCPFHNINALMIGVMLAFGFWIGPETIILLGMVLGVTGLAWVAGEEGASRRNLFAASGLASGLIVMVLIEKGFGDFLAVEYDRISIVHVTLALLVLAFWSAVAATHRVWDQAGVARRMVLGSAGAGLTILVLRLLYERLLLNPLTDVDPVVLKIFLTIAEYGPIDDITRFLLYLGSIVFAAPWVVWQAKRNWTSRHRWTWLVVAAALFVYTALAVTWVRWSLYAGFFLALVIADLIVHADGAINRRFRFPRRTVVKVAVILFIVIGPVLAAMIGLSVAGADEKAEAESCPVAEVTRFLNRPEWVDRPRTIAASTNFGAEIMYRTPHKVVATVSHRNTAGVYDGYRIFSAKDEGGVLALALKRRVDLLLLCPDTSHDGYFLNQGRDGTFYQRLMNGDLPGWLRQVPLPDKAASAFRLFEVP